MEQIERDRRIGAKKINITHFLWPHDFCGPRLDCHCRVCHLKGPAVAVAAAAAVAAAVATATTKK